MQELDYKFFDSQGVEMEFAIPVKIPVTFKPNFSWKDKNTLSFKKGNSLLCIGYKARPIIKVKEGDGLRPLAPGTNSTIGGSEAKTILYQ